MMFCMYGSKKDINKTLLTLSKSGRAFAISQNGLEGFINYEQNDIESWLHTYRKDTSLRFSVTAKISDKNLEILIKGMEEISDIEEKDKYFRKV